MKFRLRIPILMIPEDEPEWRRRGRDRSFDEGWTDGCETCRDSEKRYQKTVTRGIVRKIEDRCLPRPLRPENI